jgi:hypothetical protein
MNALTAAAAAVSAFDVLLLLLLLLLFQQIARKGGAIWHPRNIPAGGGADPVSGFCAAAAAARHRLHSR